MHDELLASFDACRIANVDWATFRHAMIKGSAPLPVMDTRRRVRWWRSEVLHWASRR